MRLKPFEDIRTGRFTYDLPDDRIALFPAGIRDNSKLVIRFKDGTLREDIFRNMPGYLSGGRVLFLNNSRVIPARLVFRKAPGPRIEIFCLSPVQPAEYTRALSSTGSCTWECMVGNMRRFHAAPVNLNVMVDHVPVNLKAEMLSRSGNTAVVRFSWENESTSFATILSEAGQTPLPPYIKREATAFDRSRYQTVYSKKEGSVAAPTAGLHFTEHVFEQLQLCGIACHELTLHVGAGTFQPIKTEKVEDHRMHGEVFQITEDLVRILVGMNSRAACVGTTSVRTLESMYWLGVKAIVHKGALHEELLIDQWEPYDLPKEHTMKHAFEALGEWMVKQRRKEIWASTSLMIVPGYDFKVVDTLITNFHQPKSSLLLLIAAFIGDSWREVYEYAIKHDFRFLSYGDSSLLFR
jgi:S-adenosylmethionine:tRNA ribosyltransferase-isomerase